MEQKKELKNWIKVEILVMLVPFIAAISVRFALGSPEEFEWTDLTFIIGLTSPSLVRQISSFSLLAILPVRIATVRSVVVLYT